jgi:hypothetical protein
VTQEELQAVTPHGIKGALLNAFVYPRGYDIARRQEVIQQREREQADYDEQLKQAQGKFRPAVLADEQGQPIAASFNPATGTYHDETGNVIANPRQWEKPPTRRTGTAEPLFDKNGTVIGFRDLEGNLIGPHSPNATAEMKDILGSAQPKPPPSEAGKIAPEIEAQIGTRPDPKDYPQGAKDPEYKAASTAWGAAAEKIKNREAAATGEARGFAYGRGRFYSMLDTEGGNVPVMVTGEEIQDHPGRYISAGAGAPALTKTALIEDIRGAIGLTRESIGKMGNESFNKTQRAWLAAGLAAPAGQGSQYIDSLLRENLTEAQHDYVIRIFQLKENAMAMRSVLGAGQGSEDLRAAIIATLPGAGTPTREYADKQLQAFESQLNRLERGVPKVPLRTDIGGVGGKGMVKMQAPNGQTKDVPADQVEHYRTLGAKVVQ